MSIMASTKRTVGLRLLLLAVLQCSHTVQAADRPPGKRPQIAMENLHRSPHIQPLLRYLRCQQDELDSYGQSKPPMAAFGFLTDAMQGRPNDPVMLQVWDGLRAEVVMAAGQGFFVIAQHYPLASRDALLRVLAADGWQLKRGPMGSNHGQETDHIIQAVIPAHTGERPLEGSKGRTRRVTLIEAQLGWSVDGPNLEGLTLTCHYSAIAQQKGQP